MTDNGGQLDAELTNDEFNRRLLALAKHAPALLDMESKWTFSKRLGRLVSWISLYASGVTAGVAVFGDDIVKILSHLNKIRKIFGG